MFLRKILCNSFEKVVKRNIYRIICYIIEKHILYLCQKGHLAFHCTNCVIKSWKAGGLSVTPEVALWFPYDHPHLQMGIHIHKEGSQSSSQLLVLSSRILLFKILTVSQHCEPCELFVQNLRTDILKHVEIWQCHDV